MDPQDQHSGDSSPGADPHSTLDETEPLARRAPVAVASSSDETPAADTLEARERDLADTLSPAVRRLVRQYDLDVTGVHGTGPAGKIRVADVIGMLGGRADQSSRASEAALGAVASSRTGPTPLATHVERDEPRDADSRAALSDANEPAAEAASASPSTTVFECDLSNVLSHRKRERLGDSELLLTSYFVAACSEALRAVPELVGAAASEPRGDVGAEPRLAPALGVLLATADGRLRRTLVTAAESALDERLRAIDRQLRASDDDDLGVARLLLHHYGPSGSLLATPTPLGAGHTASVGIGRVRREVVVRIVGGEETPRVAALCFVTLTFLPARVALEQANRFVAELVRVLEQWRPAAST